MRRLCTLLGMPQNRFASIHVVGTNGKTSVTRMTAALLEAHGVSTGAYVSPHITSWRERVLIRGEPISEEAFTQALERTEQAAEVADRSAGDEGPVTQFELLTAAAFVAFAAARVQYAVIEAGLGGRLDATNVIPSQLTVLTSVGSTTRSGWGRPSRRSQPRRWRCCGITRRCLVGQVPDEVNEVIDREVAEKHARKLWATSVANNMVPGYQGRNLALAQAAAGQVLEELDSTALVEFIKRLASAGVLDPGRAELVPGDPPAIFDAAHNPDGAIALAEALPDLARGRDVVCCLAVLEGQGRDRHRGRARSGLLALRLYRDPAREHRGIRAARRAGTARAGVRRPLRQGRGAGGGDRRPDRGLGASTTACQSPEGVALAAGSHYLLSCIWTERPAQSS